MDELSSNQTFMDQVKNISVVVSLFLTVGGVAVSLFNFVTLSKLQPLSARIEVVEKASAKQDELNPNFALKAELLKVEKEINDNLKRMEDKVDYIYKQAYSRTR